MMVMTVMTVLIHLMVQLGKVNVEDMLQLMMEMIVMTVLVCLMEPTGKVIVDVL